MQIVDLTNREHQVQLCVEIAKRNLATITGTGITAEVIYAAWLPWLAARMMQDLGKDEALQRMDMVRALIEGADRASGDVEGKTDA